MAFRDSMLDRTCVAWVGGWAGGEWAQAQSESAGTETGRPSDCSAVQSCPTPHPPHPLLACSSGALFSCADCRIMWRDLAASP